MRAQEIASMFHFNFEKTTQEIRDRAQTKAAQLTGKIKEREVRMAGLRKEYGIDDAALIELLTQARRAANANNDAFFGSRFTYTTVSCAGRVEGPAVKEERTVGAGVVNNLLTENDFIEAEKDAIKRLNLIVNNLRPQRNYTSRGEVYAVDRWSLSYEELEYLGF